MLLFEVNIFIHTKYSFILLKLPGGRAPKKLDFNRFPLRRSVPDLKPYDVMVVKETGPKGEVTWVSIIHRGREIIELDHRLDSSQNLTFLSAESDEPSALDDKVSAQAAQG